MTNRKSHTGFRLSPFSMTLNYLERRNRCYFVFFSPKSIALLANYVTVVEDRPIMSAKYCLPVPVFHFWPKLTHPVRQLSYLLLLPRFYVFNVFLFSQRFLSVQGGGASLYGVARTQKTIIITLYACVRAGVR